jgi:hypothetical protein
LTELPLSSEIPFSIEVETVVSGVYADLVKPKLPIVDTRLLSIRTHTHLNVLTNAVKHALFLVPFTIDNVIREVDRVFTEFETRNNAH